MASFTDYLNANNPAAAMGGAMAGSHPGGSGDYGQMVAQLVANLGNQRRQAAVNQQAQPPGQMGGQMPGGPSLPDQVVAPQGGMPGAPMPQGGGMPQGSPAMLAAMMQGGGPMPQGGGMPQGGAPGGMDDYTLGRMIGQLLSGRSR